MSTAAQPRFDPKEVLDLYQRQAYERLSDTFLSVLDHFEQTTYHTLDAQGQYFVDTFVKNFLFLFTQPDYVLSDRHAVRFVELNLTISNLVAMSSFKNTDPYIDVLIMQPRNLAKLLALYSSRNTRRIDYKPLFDTNPQLSCLWYSYFIEAYRTALVNPSAAQNLRDHLRYDDSRLNDFYNIPDVCFGVTYIDPAQDQVVKRKLNASIKQGPLVQGAFIQNKPRKKHIAVASSLWFQGHSVHRILGPCVESLKEGYELTLIHLGAPRNNIDVSQFKRILYVAIENGAMNIDAIRSNDFQALLFPDVGMSGESIMLSNLRLAPIQVCGLGHSCSTFGSACDYYISGVDCEVIGRAAENYSERLVLIPGFGCVHEPPTYELKHPVKSTPKLVLNCPWYAQKVNYEFLRLVRQIIDGAQKPIVLRIFVGAALVRKNDFIPFLRDAEAILGRENMELVAAKGYDEYMLHMEEGDFALDCYHFGGCNSVADCLHIRKPIVCYEGTKWYNRIGPATLRSAGLDELVATNADEYRSLVLRMINDDAYRAQVQAKVNAADLLATAFSLKDASGYKRAMDYLIDNHEQLQADTSREPIIIE